jgi:hypothetical protein
VPSQAGRNGRSLRRNLGTSLARRSGVLLRTIQGSVHVVNVLGCHLNRKG